VDSGYYAAMAGLEARSQALDVAAANLANAHTTGYRAEREYFRAVLMGSAGTDSQVGEAINQYGLLGGDRLSQAQGAMEPTGNPLDLAIEGRGYFQIQTANGNRFTRDGSFHRSQQGALVTSANEPVLSESGQTILVPPGEISVGTNGVVSVAGGAVATVGVFSFPSDVELTAEGVNRYAAPAGTKATLSGSAVVHQGALEGANQDVVTGTVELIAMQRQAEMMQRALTLFHSEFNKFASEDLPRI